MQKNHLLEDLAKWLVTHQTGSVLIVECGSGESVSYLRSVGCDGFGQSTLGNRIFLSEIVPFCWTTDLDAIARSFDCLVILRLPEAHDEQERQKLIKQWTSLAPLVFLCVPFFDQEPHSPMIESPSTWARSFAVAGFYRYPDNKLSQFIIFHSGGSISDTIAEYEDSLWVTKQLVIRQRALLSDYRKDILREVYESELIESRAQSWQHKWEMFEASRTWRMLMTFQAIRNRLVPRNSHREAIILMIGKFERILRQEGIIALLKAIFRKLRRISIRKFALLRLRLSPRSVRGRVCQIEPLPKTLEKNNHQSSLDVIICIHNALDDVRRCLESVIEWTTPPFRIILVDDGSGVDTADYLCQFVLDHPETLLLRSEEGTGYTFAANRGLRASSADYVILLNSDTIVSPYWADRLIACAESKPKIGIVGPLSNTASWQSIPKIEENGDWASNPLPPDITVQEMGRLVGSYTAHLYPLMPFINGFCLLIKRQLIEEVGIFDEDNFGRGYGEEDDLILRARRLGWLCALADDAYIYHAQSRSYSNERRHELSTRAGKVLAQKHGTEFIQQGVAFAHKNRVLEGIRARAQVMFDREECIHQGRKFSGKRILFILPIAAPGGGGNVVVFESLSLLKMGISVEIFNLTQYQNGFSRGYPNLPFPVRFGEISDLPVIASQYDAVIATHNSSVEWIHNIPTHHGQPVRGYYIQGFEPLMYDLDTQEYKSALASYICFPELVRFTKTEWTRQEVRRHTGVDSTVIGVSLDIDLFRPRPRMISEWPDRPLRIAAMIRPEAPYREPEKTMLLLKQATHQFPGQVEAVLFGTQYDNPDFLKLTHDFPWQIYGVLSSEEVSNLLNQVDIFIDYSSHQAMGLTALEAMSCGCAVIVPEYGGAISFCRNEQNSLVVDASSYEKVWAALKRLIEDETLRKSIQAQAIYDVCQYFPERTALNLLKCLFETL